MLLWRRHLALHGAVERWLLPFGRLLLQLLLRWRVVCVRRHAGLGRIKNGRGHLASRAGIRQVVRRVLLVNHMHRVGLGLCGKRGDGCVVQVDPAVKRLAFRPTDPIVLRPQGLLPCLPSSLDCLYLFGGRFPFLPFAPL